jgi:antitoxin HicB
METRRVEQKKAGATALAEQCLGHVYPVQLDREEDGGRGSGSRHDRPQRGGPASSPASGRPVVRLPALTAAKLEVYRAMREAGLDAAQLAQRLGWPPNKITHFLDGCHVVRLEQLEAALAALGRRLVVSSEAV